MKNVVLLTVSLLIIATQACKAPTDPASAKAFADDFNRSELGDQWNMQGGGWRIIDGALHNDNAHNKALWLKHPLPRNVQVEFDATSASAAVDLKCEIFGDGQTHQSGYIIINGGWHNSVSIIARRLEHEIDKTPVGSVPYKRKAGLKTNHTYHWKVVRQGDILTQYLDGQKYLERQDNDALYGPANNKFAFNNWEAQVRFDNLKITPLP